MTFHTRSTRSRLVRGLPSVCVFACGLLVCQLKIVETIKLLPASRTRPPLSLALVHLDEVRDCALAMYSN